MPSARQVAAPQKELCSYQRLYRSLSPMKGDLMDNC